MAIKENIQLRCQLQILKRTAHRLNQHFVRTAVSFFVGTDDIF
jgi:hypothetical protein